MIEYSDIQTTVVVIFALFAAIVTIDKVFEIYLKATGRMKKPKEDIEHRLDDHDTKLDNDHKEIEKQSEAIRLLVRGMSQLMTHEIDGNHVDQLIKTRDDMNEFLINKM